MTHLAVGEGLAYTIDLKFISPTNMGDMDWTEDEIRIMSEEIIPEVIRINKRPHSEWFPDSKKK